MPLLIVNAGSTTVKYKLFQDDLKLIQEGIIDKRYDKNVFKLIKDGEKYEWEISDQEFESSSQLIFNETKGFEIKKMGFRVVHGGEHFSKPTRIDNNVIESIENLNSLAPLHNPPALTVIRGFEKILPEIPKYAVFDTAFHSTMPERAFLYALPYEYYSMNKIRRYGFHGTSHKFVTEILRELEPKAKKIISCHLGGGASITAVLDGKSVDTSMGFTPLEGLVMATRTGDIDAGIIIYMSQQLGMSPSEVNQVLNKESGLLGISQNTSDMRALLELEQKGDKLATLAIELYVYRIQKYIGAYSSVLGGIDSLCFTAGIGQGSDVIRKRICANMSFLNIQVDDSLNDGKINVSSNLKISSSNSIPIWVIPTNEELEIAEQIIALE